MDGNTPVLELEGVSKSFGPVQALSEVDFKVHNGEVVALVGDNGAGKSTLVKAIAGIHPVDEGRIVFEGNEVRIAGPTDATDLGIATVYQDLALCDNLDVVENLFLGREEGGVVLDEPTAALGVRQTAMVLNLIKRLKEEGHAVVVISHNLADVFEVADRIFVLRLGRKAADLGAHQASQEEVVAAIAGAEFGPIAEQREDEQ